MRTPTTADLAGKVSFIDHGMEETDALSTALVVGWHRSNFFLNLPSDAVDGQGNCLVIYYAGTGDNYWGTRIFKEPHGYRMWMNQSLGHDGWQGWISLPTSADLAAITPGSIGAMSVYPHDIELTPDVGTGHGGVIDFHFNGSKEDFTSRIVESGNGVIWMNGLTVRTDMHPSVSLARNTALFPTDTTPTSNGAINWTYG